VETYDKLGSQEEDKGWTLAARGVDWMTSLEDRKEEALKEEAVTKGLERSVLVMTIKIDA